MMAEDMLEDAESTGQDMRDYILRQYELGSTLTADERDQLSASEQQALAMEQLNKGIEQISSVVQSNSATAQESSATSEELSAQAFSLEELVGRFELKQQA